MSRIDAALTHDASARHPGAQPAGPTPGRGGGDPPAHRLPSADMRRSPGDEIESEADSVLGTGWGDTLAGPQADRAEPGMRNVGAGSALTRIHRTYIAARASIGVALVVGIVGISVFGQRPHRVTPLPAAGSGWRRSASTCSPSARCTCWPRTPP